MFKLFSHNDSKNLFFYTIYSMTLVSLILGVVSGGIVIYGNDFMNIWMGNKFTGYAPLIFLTVAYLPFTLPSQVINQSFTVMNKVMMPAMFTILTGLMNILLSIIFVKLFQWNIYGVALASLVVQVFRDCILFPVIFTRSVCILIKNVHSFFAALASIVITIAYLFRNSITNKANFYFSIHKQCNDSWRNCVVYNFVYFLILFLGNFQLVYKSYCNQTYIIKFQCLKIYIV